jgi:hypothetical protein
MTFCKPDVSDVLKPDVLKPDVLKPDVLWVYPSNCYYYLQWAVTPNQITQQNSLQRAGGPKGSKGETLRPDFQANTRSRLFFKADVTTRYRKEVVRKSRYSLRQF